jgi:hypothetical protein
MYSEPSVLLRALYCLAVLSAIYPSGMSGWVAATLGGAPSLYRIPTLLFAALGLWRIYAVARHRHTLGSYVFPGPLKVLRVVGIVGLVIGTLYLVLRIGVAPIVRSLNEVGDSSTRGIAGYVAGVYVALLQTVVTPGIIVFELSRLLGFERYTHDDSEVPHAAPHVRARAR